MTVRWIMSGLVAVLVATAWVESEGAVAEPAPFVIVLDDNNQVEAIDQRQIGVMVAESIGIVAPKSATSETVALPEGFSRRSKLEPRSPATMIIALPKTFELNEWTRQNSVYNMKQVKEKIDLNQLLTITFTGNPVGTPLVHNLADILDWSFQSRGHAYAFSSSPFIQQLCSRKSAPISTSLSLFDMLAELGLKPVQLDDGIVEFGSFRVDDRPSSVASFVAELAIWIEGARSFSVPDGAANLYTFSMLSDAMSDPALVSIAKSAIVYIVANFQSTFGSIPGSVFILAADDTASSASSLGVFREIVSQTRVLNSPGLFQITLWLSIFLFVLLFAAIWAIAGAETRRDSLLYSKFNPNWDKKTR